MKVDSDSGKYRIVAEINMIPFIDIALVLLIIFMVMTPFLVRSQIKVNLPKAATAEQAAEDTQAVSVQVDREGNIYVAGQRTVPTAVEPALRRALRHPQTQPLLIEADKGVAFEHVVLVLDAGKKIGSARMAVCVKPDAGRGAP